MERIARPPTSTIGYATLTVTRVRRPLLCCRLLLAVVALSLPCQAEPRRIVSTGPAITEILFSLGLGDRVVGVSTFCHYPAAAAVKPRIGTYLEPNIEVIASLKPDLVVIEKLPNQTPAHLARLKLPVLEVRFGTIADNLGVIRQLAAAAGVTGMGDAVERDVRQRLDTLRARSAGLPRKSMVFIVGRNAGALEGMVAAGRGSYLSELMEIAGGRNVFADTKMSFFKVSIESLAGADPDVIVDMGEMAATQGVTAEQRAAVAALWKKAPQLRAVRAGRVHAVSSDIFVVPGPRMADAAEAFAAILGSSQGGGSGR